MSELTQCNLCTLQDIKNRNRGKKVEVKPDKENGGYNVYVDGECLSYWFMAISEYCCC